MYIKSRQENELLQMLRENKEPINHWFPYAMCLIGSETSSNLNRCFEPKYAK